MTKHKFRPPRGFITVLLVSAIIAAWTAWKALAVVTKSKGIVKVVGVDSLNTFFDPSKRYADAEDPQNPKLQPPMRYVAAHRHSNVGQADTKEGTVRMEANQTPKKPAKTKPAVSELDQFSVPEYEADKLPLFRDLYGQEPWPERESAGHLATELNPAVHYVWCGQKELLFRHYLGLLSAVRVVQPPKLVFHYTDSPLIDADLYNTWFLELKQSVSNLNFHRLPPDACGSPRRLLKTALSVLAQNGGLYIGENVILTKFPPVKELSPFWVAFPARNDTTPAVVFASQGIDVKEKVNATAALKQKSKFTCVTANSYNTKIDTSVDDDDACVIMSDVPLYPRDIWRQETRFAELARWLFYGRRRPLVVEKDESNLIPRISHYFWRENYYQAYAEFHFQYYLSVLSALYVAGFHHVYVHAETEPKGRWWDALKGENVTYVRLDLSESVFGQKLETSQHISDTIRLHLVHKYGGAHQDVDVLWLNRVPDSLLAYPVVLSPDWPEHGQWPDTINTGVLLGRARAPWLRHFLATMGFAHVKDWDFNAIRMPYRTYERFPDLMHLDRHLQVICFYKYCHPTWHPDYKRWLWGDMPTSRFNLTETLAVHFTQPKPFRSISSPAEVRNSSSAFAQFARELLERCGKAHIFKEN